MSSPCNTLNVQQIKVSDLVSYSSLKTNDLLLVIESGSLGTYYSRKSQISSLVSLMHTGSFTGSFVGLHLGSAKLTGSLNGNLKGNFSGSGKITGSFTGSTRGISYTTGSMTGSFKGKLSGSFNGNLKGVTSGSTSGSHYGIFKAFDQLNANYGIGFVGTASWSDGNPIGTGVTNYIAYWQNNYTLASNQYLQYDLTTTNLATVGTGRVYINRPIVSLHSTGQGEQLLQYSSSATGELYSQGLQPANSYLRTGKNYTIFYSGSHNTSATAYGPKDAYWYADKTAKVGKSGWTVIGTRQRLVGIGHFDQSQNVGAQLHVHLSSSYGWPDYSYLPNSTPFKPNTNVFLITSGSGFSTLMRVSGSGIVEGKKFYSANDGSALTGSFKGRYESNIGSYSTSTNSETITVDFDSYNIADLTINHNTPTITIKSSTPKVAYLTVKNSASTTVTWNVATGTLQWSGGTPITSPTNTNYDLFMIVNNGQSTKLITRIASNFS